MRCGIFRSKPAASRLSNDSEVEASRVAWALKQERVSRHDGAAYYRGFVLRITARAKPDVTFVGGISLPGMR